MSQDDSPTEAESPVPQEIGALPVPETTEPVDQLHTPRREVEKQREDTRSTITILLFFLLIAQLGLGGIGAAFLGEQQWAQIDEYLKFTVPGTIGLLGSAIGFYFGSQR